MFFLSRIDPWIVVAGALLFCSLILFLYVTVVRHAAIHSRWARRTLLGLLLLLSCSFLLESLIPRSAPFFLREGVYALFGLWICAFALLLPVAALLWVLAWLHRRRGLRFSFTAMARLLLLLPLLVTAYGASRGSAIEVTDVTIPVRNLPTYWHDKTLVHLTDLHLRDSSQIGYVAGIVEKIERSAPELVVITGDLFDVRSRDQAQALLAPFGQLLMPVLFVSGNHDAYFASQTNLADLGIDNLHLLDGKLFEREGLQIIGLAYPRGRGATDPATILRDEIPFDRAKPTILLYHLPTTIESDKQGDRYISPNTDFTVVKEMGIDLQLSGHTHGGQFFPLSWVTSLIYRGYEKGLHRDGDFSLFVSSGLGTWGPPLRIFVPPEIAVIHLADGSIGHQ